MNERATHALYVSVSLWNTITLTPWNKINKSTSETKMKRATITMDCRYFMEFDFFDYPKRKQKPRFATSSITCQWHTHQTRKNSNTNWMFLTLCKQYEVRDATRLFLTVGFSHDFRLFIFRLLVNQCIQTLVRPTTHHQHIHSHTATYITKKSFFTTCEPRWEPIHFILCVLRVCVNVCIGYELMCSILRLYDSKGGVQTGNSTR